VTALGGRGLTQVAFSDYPPEDKIQALSEMAVNQADSHGLSAQIDATAASMQATESRLSEFQSSSTVMPELLDAPAILPDDRGRLRA